MGIKNLRKFIKQHASSGIKEVSFYKEYATKSVAIDVNSYLYKFAYNSDTKPKNFYLKAFFELTFDLVKNKITPIFVFDGKPNGAKNKTLIFRKKERDKKTDAIADAIKTLCERFSCSEETLEETINNKLSSTAGDAVPETTKEEVEFISYNLNIIQKNRKNIISIDKKAYDNLITLFNLLGVPNYIATGEADFLCAKLTHDGAAAAVLSEDLDLITHGATKLITGICSIDFKKTGLLEEFSIDKILEELDLTHSQFVDLCILSGCDYCDKIKSIGINTALHKIKEYKKIEDIPEYVKISGLEEARNEFIKSKDEKYDSDKLGLKKSNHNDVVAFLTEHTTYKPATVEKKLSAFI